MTRRAWAVGFFALLMTCICALLILHWNNRETVTYLQASIKPLASTEPFHWPNGAVNVNTADFEELQTLTGINRGQIQALLDDRAKNGPFDFPEDLIYVKGIGEKTLEKIYAQLDFSWRADGN
ncbi:MAG TPA: helix-hairpin-helix domain-containing protein [Candidatus Limiplasma sp.]|nr:helix-hairpin-helix domain-containing protein [Candidatus Limiplasma sp.]HRX08416.1 helix-hairpin-helix domain-containing protein [Candidatus Limiplasma sp.]